jgi:hypothetical protein
MTGRRPELWLLLAVLAAACREAPTSEPGPAPVAKFGVFFGGQIQERQEIPFVLDSTRQTQGFRIQLPEPAPKDVEVSWEIEMPAPRVVGAGKTITKLGTATLARGGSRLDQRFEFEPGDRLGLYNVRVRLGSELVIDRAVAVYDEAARRRAAQSDD